MTHKKSFLVFLLFIFALYSGIAESLDLLLYIQKIEHASQPEVFGDTIIFTYDSPKHTFFVGARFSHENYAVMHSFRINENNIFVLAIPLPPADMTIKYRLMVDGLWTNDPKNPLQEVDMLGNVLSVINVAGLPQMPFSTPVVKNGNIVEFSLQTETGRRVYVAGDFNSWDPFSHRLAEISPGIYRLQLQLYPGKHNYYFLVDGIRMIDPRNEKIMTDSDGFFVSTVTVTRSYR
ncbi:MAG: hypothetical protein JW904_09090 [Spirochaetales bacterium]|nr:hypothetical protein [Spirochaetales bacterium]